MNIDFVKWMCEKAEGYEIYEPEGVDIPAIAWENEIIDIDDFYDDKLRYPLLLQRAIEGVNKPDKGGFITQSCDDIYVYFFNDCHAYKYFSFSEYDSIDQAKESALMYIYEQEKNNAMV